MTERPEPLIFGANRTSSKFIAASLFRVGALHGGRLLFGLDLGEILGDRILTV